MSENSEKCRRAGNVVKLHVLSAQQSKTQRYFIFSNIKERKLSHLIRLNQQTLYFSLVNYLNNYSVIKIVDISFSVTRLID